MEGRPWRFFVAGIFVVFAHLDTAASLQPTSGLFSHLPPFSPETLGVFESIASLKTNWGSSKWNINQKITCDSCIFGFTTLQTLLKLHLPADKIADIIINMCVDLKVGLLGCTLLVKGLDRIFYQGQMCRTIMKKVRFLLISSSLLIVWSLDRLIDWSVLWSIDWLISPLIDWLIDQSFDWLIDWWLVMRSDLLERCFYWLKVMRRLLIFWLLVFFGDSRLSQK